MAVADLDAIAATKACDWRYRWRSRPTPRGWAAEVQAGYADQSWRPTGACPLWGGHGETEAEALADAVSSAIQYWTIGHAGLRTR